MTPEGEERVLSQELATCPSVGLTTQIAIGVIKHVHGGQVAEAINGAMVRSGGKRSPLDQLQALHTAEEDLINVSPLIRNNDLSGRTVTEGYFGEVRCYQSAFVDGVMDFKRRFLVPQASAGLTEDRLREIRCEVVTQNSGIVNEIMARHYTTLGWVRELHSLEKSYTGCLLSVYNAVEERVASVTKRINDLEGRRTEIIGQRKRRIFGLFPPPARTRQQHDELKSIATALGKLREERDGLLAERSRKKRELAATMEVFMDFVARKKKQYLMAAETAT